MNQMVRVKRLWKHKTPDQEKVEQISKELGISETAAKVLVNRGIEDAEAANKFLNPSVRHLHDPFLMKDMDLAINRLETCLKNDERLLVYGDYDVDGISSTALLVRFLRYSGFNVGNYIPSRHREGYGINKQAIKNIAKAGYNILLATDCGSTANEEIKLANEMGLDVLVLDHHQMGPEIPPAKAVLNPHRSDCDFPFKELAAVGVAYNLCMGLRKHMRENGLYKWRKEPNLRNMLDLVALGTIADLVPLLDENRVIAKVGLQQLERSRLYGIEALRHICGLSGHIHTGHVAFQLAPRLNAAGRLRDANWGLELLLTNEQQRAKDLAKELDSMNKERKEVEREMLDDAVNMLEENPDKYKHAIILYSDKWNTGVLGVVASRLVERYFRPAVLIAMHNGVGRGSARSIESFDIYSGFKSCNDDLITFGGHKSAAGLEIEESHLESFANNFSEYVKINLKDEDFKPELLLDAELPLHMLNDEIVTELESFAPFGMANSKPMFSSGEVCFSDVKVLNDRHLKFNVFPPGSTKEHNFDVIAFNLVKYLPLLQSKSKINIAYSPAYNDWRGLHRIQLEVKDLK